MIATIDTKNKTLTINCDYLIDELMAFMQEHNVWDYKILADKGYPFITLPWWQGQTTAANPTFAATTTSN